MKISREIKTAILVLGAIALFIWGYSFLKGKNLFDNSHKYYVEYQNVEGLTTASVVTINGLTVGKVAKINIDQTTGKLVVEIIMNNPIQISKQSIATIYSPSLIGGKAISIDPKFGTTDYADNGDFLKGDVQPEMTEQLVGQIEPLKQKVEVMLENTNKMLSSINSILDEQMQTDLKQAVNNLNGTLAASRKLMSSTQPKLDTAMDNLNVISGEFASFSEKMNKLDIQSTFDHIDSATGNMDKLLANIQSGQGSIGMLLNDQQLYSNLANASKELELLLRDLKENPKRYMHFSVFGKKAIPYQSEDLQEVDQQELLVP
ncbi:MlaD family protein [Myroides sp. LJL119]